MKFSLPVWNGVKPFYFNQKIKNIEIKNSNIPGIYIRKDRNFVDYQEDYTHMTPLKWKGYIKKIRDNKTSFIKENIKNAGDCLEIGAGDDFNIKTLKWKNYTICDPFIEPYKDTKVEFIKNFYEKISFKKKFDTIIMFSVLEHTNKFVEFIKITKKILKKNGSFFLEIPIIDNQFINGDLNCLLHEHVNYFSKKGIFNLLKNFELNIENFYFKNDTGFFCIKHKRKKKQFLIQKNLHSLKKNEKIFKDKIRNFYNFLKQNYNRKIIFYGANNGLNNLLYTASKKITLNKKRIFIVDSDNNKWGKFIGSFSKSIKKPKIIKTSDLICVSSLSFYDEIILNLKKSNQIINLNDI
tara:strand:+ start:532 stop:1587 length:1056 start_codon:yes stop_codon:yes gene_type:complete